MADDNTPRSAGRPSKYQPDFARQAEQLCRLGATDYELAQFFQVSKTTLYAWRGQHEDLAKAMVAGKELADDRVESSLYQRAVGYDFDSEEIFCKDGDVTRVDIVKHVPPDVTAQIFWLKNRKKDQYRDRHEHTGPDGGAIPINAIVNVTVGGP